MKIVFELDSNCVEVAMIGETRYSLAALAALNPEHVSLLEYLLKQPDGTVFQISRRGESVSAKPVGAMAHVLHKMKGAGR